MRKQQAQPAASSRIIPARASGAGQAEPFPPRVFACARCRTANSLSSSPPGLTRWSMLSRSPDEAERNPGPIDELLCRSRISLRFIRATKKKEGKRNAGRRSVSCPARKRRAGRATVKAACAALTAVGRARLPAFHRGSHQGEYSIPKGQPGPGFVGYGAKHDGHRRQHRTQFQRSTSRTGHSAGRHDARAARERS